LIHGLVDTHAHIGDAVFDPDRGVVLKRAQNSGVKAVIAVAEALADAKRNMALASEYPMLKPAAGLYPTHTDFEAAGIMAAFIREHRTELVAIGEVGLDFWVVKEDSARDIQKAIFGMFIDLSLETGLPLNVHSRSAGRHVVAMLVERGARKVQLHAFDGKAATARPAVESGYFFSIPPSVVRSRQKQKLVKQLPLSCLLIETDSPVLGPLPGERNEPANALVALRAVAEIKGVPEAEVLAHVDENTRRLYGEAC